MSQHTIFPDRQVAGRHLGGALGYLRGRDPVVLGIAPGGMLLAKEIADQLRAPLDVLVVRPVAAPLQHQLAIAAVAADAVLLDRALIERLGVSPRFVSQTVQRTMGEVADREQHYRGRRSMPPLEGRTVVIVDDGLGTSLTARAAVTSVRRHSPHEVVFAVPVGDRIAVSELWAMAVTVICLSMPDPFRSISASYQEFPPVPDEAVIMCLRESANRPTAPTALVPNETRLRCAHLGC